MQLEQNNPQEFESTNKSLNAVNNAGLMLKYTTRCSFQKKINYIISIHKTL